MAATKHTHPHGTEVPHTKPSPSVPKTMKEKEKEKKKRGVPTRFSARIKKIQAEKVKVGGIVGTFPEKKKGSGVENGRGKNGRGKKVVTKNKKVDRKVVTKKASAKKTVDRKASAKKAVDKKETAM